VSEQENQIDEQQEEINNIFLLVGAKQLEARNTIIESVHDHAVKVHAEIEKGEIKTPLDVMEQFYRFVQDAFAASIHMAYADNVVSHDDAIEAFQLIYSWDEEAAREALANINAEYHKQREDMENAS